MRRWPRYCEMLLGLWLIVSAWVFDQPDPVPYRAVGIGAGALLIALDGHSLRYRSYAYLWALGVAGLLLGYAYFLAPAEARGTQNAIVTGLLIAMFAILPTEAAIPPASWRDFNRTRS